MSIPLIPRWIPSAGCLVLGLLIGWWLWHPKNEPLETAAPEIQLHDGAIVAARMPDAPVPETIKHDVKEVPGAKLERSVSFDIKPRAVVKNHGVQPSTVTRADCAPAHVDLGIVKMPDDTQRVIIKSDGQIVNAIDVPVFSPEVQRQLKWAAGGIYDALNRKYGAFVDRDIGPFRLGVEVIRTPDVRSYTAVVKVGIRF